ncbi:HAD-IIIA family hydrolase [Butyrivibrio sp. INlla16]|uniref:D-glycero-alpha-D-manno-heptose-1,7-bisphosphate 7-phosphatase n=1 Tax=Butyrivibrio sp. INlla16 TaxID=1520807 RepID=UPI00088EFF00|nr:HAD-IIIA family hydrolase [Butyrivibrio sp. INlla16]SDB60162.1 D-glycero-D-manno-heptose 1,7-bisphosphate phosphatase [Butyrivibrio sp. INlla16]
MMKKAIFLDRDGVITVEKGYAISSIEELEIYSYASGCIETIKELGYLTIIITNQSAVAKGLYSEDDLKEMNRIVMEQTGVDALYYCPHHPQGIVSKYANVCNCRKPKTGMIDQACKDYDIDLSRSFMVGDRACDIFLGQNVGVKTVLLNSGYGEDGLEEECKPDLIMDDLRQFANYLIEYH